MVRNFKGVVKVTDVQEEFDNLLNTINAKIDEYNSSLNIEDIDYNNGGPDLAPYGYTLSVGGLKAVLEAYDGAILGANVLRRSNGQYIVSEGLYIKDGSAIRLPSKVVEGEGTVVYYHPTSNKYTFAERDEETLLVVEGCQIGETDIVPDYIAPAGSFITHNNSGFVGLNNEQYVPAGQEASENKLDKSYVLMPFRDKYVYTFPCAVEGASMSHDILLGFFDNDGCWQTVLEIPSLYMTVTTTTWGSRASAYYYKTSGYNATWDSGGLRYTMSSSGYGLCQGTQRNPVEFDYEMENIPLGRAVIQIGNWNDISVEICAFMGKTDNNKYLYDPALQWTRDLGLEDYNKITHIAIIPNANMVTQSYPWRQDFFGMYNGAGLVDAYSTVETINEFLGSAQNELYIETPTDGIRISAVNKNRISRLCNRPNATNESIPDYKVTIESKNSGYVINGNQSLSNSEKGQFFSGSAGRNCRINLFDTQVAYHQWHGDRTDSYHEPFNFMFIPKGISNPYNGLAGEIRFAMQKVWNYILQRPSR